MGDRKRVSRKRAVGTREHIVAYLADVHELFDPAGMAASRLAAAVGYPGSSVAFAQLLSGMERSGLIEREVRGKRTYRIRLGPVPMTRKPGRPAGTALSGQVDAGAAGLGAEAHGVSGVPGAAGRGLGAEAHGVPGAAGFGLGAEVPGAPGVPGVPGTAGFDYDELARRLLVQVIRRLAGTEDAEPGSAALRETVAGLEYELAGARARQGRLAEENARLRERLRAAERSLALARESLRRLPITADLDSAEVGVLQRLLSPAGDAADLEDAQSVGA